MRDSEKCAVGERKKNASLFFLFCLFMLPFFLLLRPATRVVPSSIAPPRARGASCGSETRAYVRRWAQFAPLGRAKCLHQMLVLFFVLCLADKNFYTSTPPPPLLVLSFFSSLSTKKMNRKKNSRPQPDLYLRQEALRHRLRLRRRRRGEQERRRGDVVGSR